MDQKYSLQVNFLATLIESYYAQLKNDGWAIFMLRGAGEQVLMLAADRQAELTVYNVRGAWYILSKAIVDEIKEHCACKCIFVTGGCAREGLPGREIMKIHDFYCLIAIEEYGSFSQAAQALFLAQPALSRKVAAIERKWGVKLFERTPQGITPTGAGAVFLQHARSVVSEYEALKRDMTDFNSGISGSLRISYVPLVGQPKYLLETFKYIKRNDPAIEISPRRIFAVEAVQALDRGEIDCCLVSECYVPPQTDFSQYEYTFVHRMKPYFLLSEASPLAKQSAISFRDISGRTLVITNNQSVDARTEHILRSCALAQCDPPQLVLANNLEETLLILRMQDAYATSAIAVDEVVDPIKGIVTVPASGYDLVLNRILLWRKGDPNPCLPVFRSALLNFTGALRQDV